MSSKTEQTSERKQFKGTRVPFPDDGQCPFCEWKCHSMKSSTFSEHIRRKHAEELGRDPTPYQCTQCSSCFSARTHLNHHIANHHKIIYQHCPHPDCEHISKNKASMITHYVSKHMKDMLKTSQKSKKCVICARNDLSHTSIRYHIGICFLETFNNK